MIWKRLRLALDMIRFEHSVFALPFALTGALLAWRDIGESAAAGRRVVSSSWRFPGTLLWIIIAMVCARSAAMAFNRLVDARIDARNPRTRMRHLPAGLLSRGFAWAFVAASSALFVVAAAQLNPLCLRLSPVALGVVFFYSFTKRFTSLSHLVLGLSLGIAPTAAWIAVRGSLDPRILLLTAAVTFWVGGFDVIYACQDHEYDSRHGLHSLPRYLGIRNALVVARVFHLVMLGLLAGLVITFGLGKLAIFGVIAVAALLLYEHTLVRHDDLTKLNAAFFTMNGVISVVFFLFVAGDLLVRRG